MKQVEVASIEKNNVTQFLRTEIYAEDDISWMVQNDIHRLLNMAR